MINSPEVVIGVTLWDSILSLLVDEDVFEETGLSGILFPCESTIKPLRVTRVDVVRCCCSGCCLIVAADCTVLIDELKLDKSMRLPRSRILSLSI